MRRCGATGFGRGGGQDSRDSLWQGGKEVFSQGGVRMLLSNSCVTDMASHYQHNNNTLLTC